jgi:hypothetical protein
MSMPAVKNIRVNTPSVSEATERAARRYLRLIEELGFEEGAPKHGWKSAVARRLGVDQSYVSRLLSRDRISVGADSVEKAVTRLKIRRDYFDAAREPRSYKDYLGNEPVFAAWRDFLRTPVARTMTEEERVALTSMILPAGDEPTQSFYEGVLFMLRHQITHAEFVRGVEKASEIDHKHARRKPPKG